MARPLCKCVFVFLVLALSGLIFLLRNIHSVEVRGRSTAMLRGDGEHVIAAIISPCRAVIKVFSCQITPSLVVIYPFSSSLLCRT